MLRTDTLPICRKPNMPEAVSINSQLPFYLSSSEKRPASAVEILEGYFKDYMALRLVCTAKECCLSSLAAEAGRI